MLDCIVVIFDPLLMATFYLKQLTASKILRNIFSGSKYYSLREEVGFSETHSFTHPSFRWSA